VGIGVIILSVYAIVTDFYARRSADGSELIDLSEDGSANNSTEFIMSIDKAHSLGLRHRGVWLHIVNESNEILLLKRRAQAVTCPATWNAPGEHTKHLESYASTAYRGLSEELGLNRTQIYALIPLTRAPTLLEIQYMPPLRKHDAQWTQSYLVRSFVYTSAEQQIVRRATSFREMLIWHARRIQQELDKDAVITP
jgi:hypothetical protein